MLAMATCAALQNDIKLKPYVSYHFSVGICSYIVYELLCRGNYDWLYKTYNAHIS